MSFNFFSNNTEHSDNKKRGRPKRPDEENRSKRFNLIMKPSTMSELNKIAAKRQLQDGTKTSVTGLINQILEEFIAREEI
ncbi:MAG: hypothetical protein IJ587_08375 [Synergistaceae bacterium]|nr:hypothetical protein [Synergistaceae bacterium]